MKLAALGGWGVREALSGAGSSLLQASAGFVFITWNKTINIFFLLEKNILLYKLHIDVL